MRSEHDGQRAMVSPSDNSTLLMTNLSPQGQGKVYTCRFSSNSMSSISTSSYTPVGPLDAPPAFSLPPSLTLPMSDVFSTAAVFVTAAHADTIAADETDNEGDKEDESEGPEDADDEAPDDDSDDEDDEDTAADADDGDDVDDNDDDDNDDDDNDDDDARLSFCSVVGSLLLSNTIVSTAFAGIQLFNETTVGNVAGETVVITGTGSPGAASLKGFSACLCSGSEGE